MTMYYPALSWLNNIEFPSTRWLSATCWEIAAGALEGRPEGGVYAILGQRPPPSGQALSTGPPLNKRYRDFLPPCSRNRAFGALDSSRERHTKPRSRW